MSAGADFQHWKQSISPPMLTADLPGIGGRIKVEPEDFEVEEIPAYPPSGQGEFLFLWVEKRGMGAEFFERLVARTLDLAPNEVGAAGLKDRHAVTRQMISVPAAAEPRVPELEREGIRVLAVHRHGNKLRPGHLHGNRFRILVRDADLDPACLHALLARLREHGLLNYFGAQRFGVDGETLELGVGLLLGARKVRNPFLKRLALSAMQSALYNAYLAQRHVDGLARVVLPGDVLAKVPAGGMFIAEDPAREQPRLDAREVVPAGPLFGTKTFPSRGRAAERELELLGQFALTREGFGGFGKLLQGTRRRDLVYLDDLAADVEPAGLRLTFTLPAGSYATVVLRELMKAEAAPEPRAERMEG